MGWIINIIYSKTSI